MRIHLISSMRKFDEDLPSLRKIADIVYDHGHHISRNWFEAAETRIEKDPNIEESLDWKFIVQENLEHIKKSDVLISEGSRFNYSQGFQTAIALQLGKPVLNLCKESAPERHWPDEKFVSGIPSDNFISEIYKDSEDLEQIVVSFLNKYDKTSNKIAVELSPIAYRRLASLHPGEDIGKTLEGLIMGN